MLNMSINTASITCMNCGAPLELQNQVYNCLYCDSRFTPLIDFGFKIPAPRPELVPKGLFEVSVGETRYRILGQLGSGEHSRVLLARRAKAVTEQVVIKVAEELEILEREWANLTHLVGRCRYLDSLLPRPVDLGMARGKPALVYRWRSGFVYNLAQVRKKFRAGVDPAAAIWMWNRVLDQLTSLRQLGYSHGSIRPEHLLVHPRDHGIALCGWSSAALGGQGDLAASGRCIAELLGRGALKPLRELALHASQFDKPKDVKSELRKVARAAYGPPRFRPFVIPGTDY
jgi:hypothetical protein